MFRKHSVSTTASLEIFEWYLTDCQQTNAYQLTLEENKEEYFEYQASLTHLDESELPGSRTVPHLSGQSQGICSKQKNKRFNSNLVTDPHLYLLVIARARPGRGCGKLCRPDLDFLL